VRAAAREGAILPVRGRWFQVPDAPEDVVRAVRVGGTLTAASVARLEGLWLMDDDRLHVRVPSTASRLGSPGDRRQLLGEADNVCVHYSRAGGTQVGRDPLRMALAEMFACGSPRDALVSLDSALNMHAITGVDLQHIRASVDSRMRPWVDRADAGSQSGLETLVRLLLRSRNIRVRSQVWFTGIGRVDLLVGERLILELDGAQFHQGENFEADRERDLALQMRGYIVIRLSYRQVMGKWDVVMGAILELIARGEHRWSGRRPSAPVDWP
jgi:very-short-patch-repair endonuclease